MSMGNEVKSHPVLNGRPWIYPARLNPGEHEIFVEMVRSTLFLPGDYLETGTAYGGSVIMASHAFGGEKTIHAVDPMDWLPDDPNEPCHVPEADGCISDLKGCFWGNISISGTPAEKINLIEKKSEEIIDGWDRPLCALFLDSGDHNYPLVKNETRLIDHLLPGGVVLFHNSDLHGVQIAMREAEEKYNLQLVGSRNILTIYRKPPYPQWRQFGGYMVPFTRLWEEIKDLPTQQCATRDIPGGFFRHMGSVAYGEVGYCAILIDAMKVEAADLSYPVIFGPDGTLWDGFHRIVKAHVKNMPVNYVIWPRGVYEFGPKMLGWLMGTDEETWSENVIH